MMEPRLTFDALRAQLPQDYPFVLLDRVIEIVPSRRIVALKNISASEWILGGCLSDRVVYPSVLLIESMAQASILLFKESVGPADGSFLIIGVRSRFLAPVTPGDQVVFTCTAQRLISTGSIVTAEATVAGVPVATATLTFAVSPTGN